jgi:hypothetical protein
MAKKNPSGNVKKYLQNGNFLPRYLFAISSFGIIEVMASEFGAFILSVSLPRPTQCLEA